MKKLIPVLFCAIALHSDSLGQGTISKPPPPAGVNAQTASYTATASDDNKLITMNCASCTLSLPPSPPSPNWAIQVEDLNSTAVTVSRNSLGLNGGTSNISLPQFQQIAVWTDGTNYFSSVPFLAGTNVTITAATNGNTIAATGGGGGGGTVTTTGSPASGNLTAFSGATSITNGNLSGDVSTTNTLATTIGAGAVSYSKMQNVSNASRLLGSSATGSGAPPSEITLGTNLSMSGSTLNASGGGSGTVTSISAGTGITLTPNPIVGTGTVALTTPVTVANGGTGTASPSLVAGTNVTISGTWPNQTINSTAGGGGGTTTNALTFGTGLSAAPSGAFNGSTAQTVSVTNPVPANLTLTNPSSAATLSVVGGTTLTGPAATDTLVGRASTDTLTNKTFDAHGTGNTLKRYEYVQLIAPDNGDGTNALRVTTEGPTYGHFTFSNSAAKASNYVLYRFRVPDDLDASFDLTANFSFRLGGADTGSQAYSISMADVTPGSASADNPSFINETTFTYSGDATGASGRLEQTGWVTLLNWRTSLTAGHVMVVKIARDGGNVNDSSTVNSNDVNLTIRYQSTQ